MESFLQTLGQHLSSLLNLSLMRRLDTGDRMVDTTLQMLFSTLIGGIITGLVTLYTKGLWLEAKHRALCLVSATEHDPLKFDPRMAPDKPTNGTCFLYEVYCNNSRWTAVASWFYTYHADKFYGQKLSSSLPFPGFSAKRQLVVRGRGGRHTVSETRNDTSLLSNPYIHRNLADMCIPKGIYLPIWRGGDGFFVYLTTNDQEINDICYLYSDSAAALRACVEHIEAHGTKMDAYGDKEKGEGQKLFYLDRDMDVVPMQGDASINPNKTFDTLFFTQKAEALRLLANFRDGTLFPAHLPIDTKLGFLLYGPPGTGKTGFIAAVANFLERHVLIVDTSRIRTRREFDSVFEADPKQFIFVFEEFDCMLGTQMRSRGVDEGDEGDSGSGGGSGNGAGMDTQALAMMMLAGGQKGEKDSGFAAEFRKEREAAADQLDLGYLLRKLDGLENGDGRVIIATTNHPERIDSALLRPGRFGIQLHLTRCTAAMLRDLVAMIYQVEGAEALEKLAGRLAGIPEEKWSPAEVLQLGITLEGLDAMVEHLTTKEPQRDI